MFALHSEVELPVKPQKEWVHMDKLEPEKLEWMKDLPPPRKKGTEKVNEQFRQFCSDLLLELHLFV